jgi:RNA polymerase sigma factor (sigma-70 family)
MSNHDQSEWENFLHALETGEAWAFQQFWDEYYDGLVRYARKKIGAMPLRMLDEEDIAVSAMHSFFRGLTEKRFIAESNLEFRKLLTTIIVRKLQKQRTKQFAKKRGSGQVRGESVFRQNHSDEPKGYGFETIPDNQERPDLCAEFCETTEKLFGMLQDQSTQQVAQLLLEGYSINEIAEQLGCVRRTVERKIERIRTLWGGEFHDE